MQVNYKYWGDELKLSERGLAEAGREYRRGSAILKDRINKDGDYMGVGHHSFTPDKARLYADMVLRIDKIIAARWPELAR